MDRLALLDRIAVEYDAMLDAAGIIVADDPAGLGAALDTTQSIFERNESIPPYLAYDVFSYFVLDRVVTSLASMFDVTIDGDSYRLNQLYKNAVELRAAKRTAIGWIIDGDVPGEAAADTFGNVLTIVTPFLGPEGEW